MKRTRIFLDCEFSGLHSGTTLISIGLISDTGNTFYAELTDYDSNQIDDWLTKNVISKLTLGELEKNTVIVNGSDTVFRGDKASLRKHLGKWLNMHGPVEIWSDCLAYDWVLFNDVFEHAFKIPKNVYYIPFDLCTLFKIKGIDPDISREAYSEQHGAINSLKHTALYDAITIKKCYDKVVSL